MKVNAWLVALCLSPLAGLCADGAPKPGNSVGTATPVHPGLQQPSVSVPEISVQQATAALFSLIPLIQEFDTTVKPLGSHYHPFSLWAGQTRQELQASVEAAKMGKTSGEIVQLSHKAKQQFEKAIKIAKAIVPLDADVDFLNNQIATTSQCLAKRQAALQQADTGVKTAIQLAMGGMPANVSAQKSLLASANAACL